MVVGHLGEMIGWRAGWTVGLMVGWRGQWKVEDGWIKRLVEGCVDD